MKKQYRTVVEQDHKKLDAEVSKLREDGWELYGHPIFAMSVHRDSLHIQALIKDEIPPSDEN